MLIKGYVFPTRESTQHLKKILDLNYKCHCILNFKDKPLTFTYMEFCGKCKSRKLNQLSHTSKHIARRAITSCNTRFWRKRFQSGIIFLSKKKKSRTEAKCLINTVYKKIQTNKTKTIKQNNLKMPHNKASIQKSWHTQVSNKNAEKNN